MNRLFFQKKQNKRSTTVWVCGKMNVSMEGGKSMVLMNYKYAIYPTNTQTDKLQHWINICRMQYNSALLDKKRIYKKEKRTYKRMDMQKQQTMDKKSIPMLKELPSQPLQEVFFRLEKAFENFFRKRAKYPKLKKYKEFRSLTFTQFGIGKQYYKKINTYKTVRRAASFTNDGKLLISKLGAVDIVMHRPLIGKIKQVIIKKQSLVLKNKYKPIHR
ncbi:RNA-guided endonuclease InsQ/TnpB family protein [Radiobacillus sp. PE A8.2]|uniref:RNA-guided endonuclease InsQ/TnpB family protein n=1 Tax=Radiobacillus sp. PE A8.2 TaxID=3380349 RepID=UPI00388DD6FA